MKARAHSGVWPWLAQACATLQNVENSKQSEVAAFLTSASQDEVGRLSHGGQERIPLDDAQFLPFACGKGYDPAT